MGLGAPVLQWVGLASTMSLTTADIELALSEKPLLAGGGFSLMVLSCLAALAQVVSLRFHHKR
jgi:hypothetical protein